MSQSQRLWTGINTVMTAFIVVAVVRLVGTDQEFSSRTVRAAQRLQMKPYIEESPFVVYVDRAFPNRRSFVLTSDLDTLVVSVEDSFPSAMQRSVNVTLSKDFTMAAKYSVAGGNIKVNEFRMIKRDWAFIDINVDGSYDQRVTFQAPHPKMEIWFNEQWVEVGPAIGTHAHLGQDGEFRFDSGTGKWRLRR